MRVVETINMYTITNAKNISTKSRSYPFVRIIFLHETKKKWKSLSAREKGVVNMWESTREFEGMGKEKYFLWKIILFVVGFIEKFSPFV